jgi:hypothetical protein
MADMEMVKFTKAVEQLSDACANDVVKLIDGWLKAVATRTSDLADEIAKVPVPAKTAASELDKIPDQVSKIIEQKGSSFNRLVKLIVKIKIDSKARTMRVLSTGTTSPVYG